jgi:hypothetical protein
MKITNEMWPQPAGQQLHSLGEELKRKIHRINQRRGGSKHPPPHRVYMYIKKQMISLDHAA